MALPTTASLLCIPTPMERALLARIAPDVVDPGRWAAVATVGFGPVAAAARAAALIAEGRPSHVVLIGIAGTYGPESEVGQALQFADVALDGVGAGEGDSFVSPDAMGFPQWHGEGDVPAVHSRIALFDPSAGESPGAIPRPSPVRAPDPGPRATLVTACAAAADEAMCARRRRAHPGAAAEDMEGFGVALSAHIARVPVTVIRGLSNVAGNRDAASWSIPEALEAAAALLRPQLT